VEKVQLELGVVRETHFVGYINPDVVAAVVL
jgi:hypothetical protein